MKQKESTAEYGGKEWSREGRRDTKLYSQNRHHLEMPFEHRSEAGEGVSHANI